MNLSESKSRFPLSLRTGSPDWDLLQTIQFPRLPAQGTNPPTLTTSPAKCNEIVQPWVFIVNSKKSRLAELIKKTEREFSSLDSKRDERVLYSG